MSTGILAVTFDQPLAADPALDAGNWSARADGDIRAGVSAATAGDQVVVVTSPAGPNPGPDVVTFTPPPFDVLSAAGGLPAAGFADYPLVVV